MCISMVFSYLITIIKIIVPLFALYANYLATDSLKLKKITCTILQFDTIGWFVFDNIKLLRFH